MQTAIYRLEPAAPPGDPNWDRAFYQGVVVVRALSSGDARVVASHGEAAALSLARPRPTTRVTASALRDVRLYRVVRDTSGRHADEGPRKVLDATFQIPDDYAPAEIDD